MAWNPFQAPKVTKPRRAERHAAHGLSCPLGTLRDLSVTGMRCRCVGKPEVVLSQTVPLVIRNEGQGIRVQAQVVWIRRVGGIRSKDFELGLRFVDVTPVLAQALDQLCHFGYVNKDELGKPAGGDDAPIPGESQRASSGQASSSSPGHGNRAPTAYDVEIEDLYRLLNVSPLADGEAIKKAFHDAAKKWHPDVCKDANAREMFEDVNKAFKVLRDPVLRKRYDAMLRASKTMHRRPA